MGAIDAGLPLVRRAIAWAKRPCHPVVVTSANRRLAPLVALVLVACTSSSETGVVVVFDADYDLAAEADKLIMTVSTDRDLAYAHIVDIGGSDPLVLPASFGIVGWDDPENPEGGSLDHLFAISDYAFEVELQLERVGPDGYADMLDWQEVAATGAYSELVVGRVTRLTLHLANRCLTEAESCAEDETCSSAGCVPRAQPASDLPDW